jgi:hypothetical protein
MLVRENEVGLKTNVENNKYGNVFQKACVLS